MKLKSIKNIKSNINLKSIASAYDNRSKKRLFISFVIIFCVVFSIVFLYQPTREFYLSVRENNKLNAQYQAIIKTNQELTDDIEALKTEEGVKQKAIDTLGLIQEGESIGYVADADIEDGRESSASSTSSKLAYKNIKTPVTWYSPFLDFIFNVHD